MHFDFLEIQTHSRLGAVRSLLDAFDKALPELKKREREALERRAENENWDYVECDVERQHLDYTFKYWLPRLAAYSVISLLYAVLESQLNACAGRVRKQSHTPFELSDIKGRGIDPAALYLKKLKAYDFKQDNEWNMLIDLRTLRNIVVHQIGSKENPDKHHEKINRLSKNYLGDLKFSDNFLEDEMWISSSLCRRFTDAVERVLNRVLAAVTVSPIEPGATPSKE